jgi:hypothetical protein
MTTSSPVPAPVHPVLGFARALDAALDKVAAGPDPVFMSPGEKKQALIELSRQVERVQALRHRLLAVADDAADAEAARSVAALTAHHTRRDYPRVAAEALDKLPDWVTADQLASAETHLIDLAQEWAPHGLRDLAAHL